MKVKGVSFSTSARAIVLPQGASALQSIPIHQEEAASTMPMIDKTRIDKRLHDLLTELRAADPSITITGTDSNRIKLSRPDGRSCYLPANFSGNSDINYMRKQLRQIGLGEPNAIGMTEGLITTDNGEQVIGSALLAAGSRAEVAATFFGLFEVSPETQAAIAMTQQLLLGDLCDLLKGITEKANANNSDAASWQTIAEAAENKLTEVRAERDAAVGDIRRQRDEARARAEQAEKELADVKRSLSGLSVLFKDAGNGNG